MTNNTPSGAKKASQSTEPESRQTAKTLFFLSFFLSFFLLLVQICVTLSQWSLRKTAAFFH